MSLSLITSYEYDLEFGQSCPQLHKARKDLDQLSRSQVSQSYMPVAVSHEVLLTPSHYATIRPLLVPMHEVPLNHFPRRNETQPVRETK